MIFYEEAADWHRSQLKLQEWSRLFLLWLRQKTKQELLSILNGNTKLLIDKINEKIKINSENLNFEVCKELVDELEYIKQVFSSQNVELSDNSNKDIFNYYYDNSYISIVTFFIRNGKLVGINNKIIPVINDIQENKFK